MPGITDDFHLLNHLAQGEYGQTLGSILSDKAQELAFKRVGRLLGVYLKEPFAISFSFDPDSPSNWARSQRFWEIRNIPDPNVIASHEARFSLLAQIAGDWHRPIEYVAEYNVFLWLCRKFRPIVCGEAKTLENSEKIAKDLEKQGIDVATLSMNQGFGIAAVTVASYLSQQLPDLANHSPIVTGATLLVLCFGQRKLCKFMTEFDASYDKSKDRFATRSFPVCGSTDTRTSQPCGALVRAPGLRCARHA